MSGWAEELTALHTAAMTGAGEPLAWEDVHARAGRLVSLLLAVDAVTDGSGAGPQPDAVLPTPAELEDRLGASLGPEVRGDLVHLQLLDVESLMPWLAYARLRVVVRQLEATPGSGGSEGVVTGSPGVGEMLARRAGELGSVIGTDGDAAEAAAGGLSAFDELLDAATDTSVVLAGMQVARAYLSGGDTDGAGAQMRQALGVHTAGRAVGMLTGLEGARLAVVLSATGYGAAQRRMVAAISPSLQRTAALTAVLVALGKA